METRIRGMEQSVKDIKDSLERIGAGRDASSNVNTVKINAGGVGVWVSSTCCMVMLAVILVGGFWISREFTRTDKELNERKEELQRIQSYVSAIYVQAPQLRPKDEKDKK